MYVKKGSASVLHRLLELGAGLISINALYQVLAQPYLSYLQKA